eukprot:11172512-Lingulodinium_polyedra.AAC.1
MPPTGNPNCSKGGPSNLRRLRRGAARLPASHERATRQRQGAALPTPAGRRATPPRAACV